MLINVTGRIGKGTYISPSAVVMGNVSLGRDVFVAPNATIRCDEPGAEVSIGDGCNIQDNAVVHCLAGRKVVIGDDSSIGHGAIVHGPCVIGRDCFIGFGTVVFDCEIGDGAMLMHRVLVEDCTIPRLALVRSGSTLVGRGPMVAEEVGPDMTGFKQRVKATNQVFLEMYGKGSSEGPG